MKERLPQLEIIFEADNKIIDWIGNQRIDIYIPCINFAIELMGPQHYEDIPYFKNGSSLQITQDRDNRKREKCKLNKCKLVEMPYYYTKEQFNNLILNIEEILYNTDDRTNLINTIQ